MNPSTTLRTFALILVVSLFVSSCSEDQPSDDLGQSNQEVADGGLQADEAPVEANTEATASDATVDADPTDMGSQPTYGGSIAVALEAESPGLRPWEDNFSSPSYNVAVNVFDKLMELNEDGRTYEPWLAESITSNADFTKWTVTLRDGVTFHNGENLTAQTIADMFVIQENGAVSGGQIASSGLLNVDAISELEVTYTLSRPNSAFPAWLERAPLGMVFEPGAAVDGEAFANKPVGTGPFLVESRDVDNKMVLVRNDDWWHTDPEGNQLPYLDSISFHPIPDEGARLDALLSDTVNAMQTLREATVRDARASVGIELYESQGSNTGGAMYNVFNPPLDDVRVRRGLNMVTDQNATIEALGGTGISVPATQWNAPDSPWYSEQAAEAYYKFDFPTGRAVLQDYVDDPDRSDGKTVGEPISVDLTCPPDPSLLALLQVMEQLYTATGLVEVNLQNFDQQTHIGIAFNDEHGIHCWRFRDDNDPATYVTAQVTPPTEAIADAAGVPGWSPINWANYWNPDVFEAALAATHTDDFATRKSLYDKVMTELNEDAVYFFSGHTATLIAVNPSIKGLDAWHLPSGNVGIGHPNAEGHWSEVWIAE